MVCTVFPSPISSARMPFSLLSCRDTSHDSPACWYSLRRSDFASRNGRGARTALAASSASSSRRSASSAAVVVVVVVDGGDVNVGDVLLW